MKKLQIILLLSLSSSAFGQWQQSTGTLGLNMQSLLTNGSYNFSGGQTGAYLSIDSAASYISSNNGNDAVGPTRGFTKDVLYTYTCTSQGVYRSSDNGATWIPKSSGLTNLLTAGIINVGTKLFVAGPTGVFMSADSAENWIAAGLPTTDVRSITAINDTLFVGTNGAGIYKSIDFGVNWTAINNGLGSAANFRAIESKGNTLFAGGSTGTGVFRSTDFGANWTLLSGGLATASYRGFASNNQLIVAGSWGSGVFYSTDNGDNWTVINNGLTDLTIFDLELNDSYIIAATNTQGVFCFPLSNLNLSTGILEPLNKHTIELYPNPTTNQINLKAAVTLLGSVYTVFNNIGKPILSEKIQSEHTIIETSQLSKGVYFIQVGRNNKNVSKIIIK